MNRTRRLVTVGVPATAMTVFAAVLALGVPSSSAAPDAAAGAVTQVAHLAVAPGNPAPHPLESRGAGGYPTYTSSPSASPSPSPSASPSPSPTPSESLAPSPSASPPCCGLSPEGPPGDELPTTGASIVLFTALGAALAAMGVLLRFLGRRRRQLS